MVLIDEEGSNNDRQEVAINADLQLESLEVSLEAALHLRSELNEQITHLARSINRGYSPISSLPTELLIRIFDLAIAGNTKRIGQLLFVCRSWTSILLSTPQLWSNIRTLILVTTLDALQDSTQYFRACIERSKEYPITIDINLVEVGFRGIMARWLNAACDEVSKSFEGLNTQLSTLWRLMHSGVYRSIEYLYTRPLAVLASASTRWRGFLLHSGDIRRNVSFLKTIKSFGMLRHSTPALERLEMSYRGHDSSICSPFALSEQVRSQNWMFPSMPNLRHYIFHGMPEMTSLYNTNWRLIQSFQARIHSPAQFAAMSSCQNLVSLNILVCPPIEYRGEEAYASHLIFQILEVFDIQISLYFSQLRFLEVGIPLGSRFWAMFAAPQLERLKLSGDVAYMDLAFLNQMELKEIDVEYPACRPEDLGLLKLGLQNVARECPSLRLFRCRQPIVIFDHNQPIVFIDELDRYLEFVEIIEIDTHQLSGGLSITSRRSKSSARLEMAMYLDGRRVA